jgi:electron transport complex protein RnfD
MNEKLVVSPSPHIHSGFSMTKMMWTVVYAMLPLWAISIYYFGWGAIYLMLVAVASCMFFEWAIAKYLLKMPATLLDGSGIITGMLIAFNIPANLPIYIVIIGSFVAIAVGKMSFGGLGQNPFNPALVGRVFMLISFPAAMTTWPVPKALNFALDGSTGATPLGIIKEGLRNGEKVSELMTQVPSYWDLSIGFMGGSMGEMSAIAILLGLVYMIYKHTITWHIPVSIIVTVAFFTGMLHLIDPELYTGPVFNLLTGGLLLGAVFMATDLVTSPMSRRGQLLFGFGVGFLTVVIRTWGAYPEGISFAILLMNAWVPLINKFMKPRRYGKA